VAQTAEVCSFMATFSNFHIWQVFPSDILITSSYSSY
jgi:hypothetical protein